MRKPSRLPVAVIVRVRIGTGLVPAVRAVEQRLTVKVRVLRDAVDFQEELRDFGLEVRAIGVAVDIRSGFDSEPRMRWRISVCWVSAPSAT